MTNEELNKIMIKADNDLEMLKDRCHELYEENERLKADEHFFTECGFTNVEQLALCYLDYKTRCEKAIEYIKDKEVLLINKNSTGIPEIKRSDLLNILQGSDK